MGKLMMLFVVGMLGFLAYDVYTAPVKPEPVNYIERYRIERIFEHEGCRVYKFWVDNNSRYFTSCSGGTWWTESCGKGCTRQVEVPTAVRP